MDYIYYSLWYVLLLAIAAALYHVFGAATFWLAAVAAILVYCFGYHVLYWTIPRRRRHTPGLVLCFTGSLLFTAAAGDFVEHAGLSGLASAIAALWNHPGLYLAAISGAFVFFYIGVKVGTPQNCTMVVHCSEVSYPKAGAQLDALIRHMKKLTTGIWSILDRLIYHRNRKNLDFERDELVRAAPPGPKGPPWVWPYEYVVGKEGCLSWHVFGEQGTLVKITLVNTSRGGSFHPLDLMMGARTRKYNPFHPTEPTVLEGVVPSQDRQPLVLSAGPAVVSGRGGYSIWAKDSQKEYEVDPGGSGPKKD